MYAQSLDQCIAMAFELNPDLIAAVHRIDASAASVDLVRADWYPAFTLSGIYSRTDNPPQAFFMNLNQRKASLDEDFNQPGDTDNIRASLGFRMLLADAGQRSMSGQIALLESSAARLLHEAARNELTYHVTRAYFTVLQAKAMVSLQEEAVDRMKRHVEVARDRHVAGSALKSDVLNLEVKLAEANESLIRSRHQIHQAVLALNTTVGRDFATADLLEDIYQHRELLPPPDESPIQEIDDRPERRAMLEQMEASSIAVKRIGRDRLPRLTAFGSVDWDSDSTSDFESSYFAGAALEWDLFTGFRRDASAAIAKARQGEIQAKERSLYNQLRQDLQRCFLNMQDAWARLSVSTQAVESATEAHRIVSEQYKEGSAGISDLLITEQQVTAASTRKLIARYDYLISQSDFQRARGLNTHTAHATESSHE